MKQSKHMRVQCQRRGIGSEIQDLVMGFGDEFKAGKGVRIYRVGRTEMRYLREECPPHMWPLVRDRLPKVASVASGEHLITAMHRYRRVRRGYDITQCNRKSRTGKRQ